VTFYRFLQAGILLALATPGIAQEVHSVVFPSRHCPPATVLPPQVQAQGALFRIGLNTLPERMLIASGLQLAERFGLDPKQLAKLAPVIDQEYANMANDPALAELPSALPYCFSAADPTNGHYFLSTPAKLPADPMCIVFLHGWGGNFQFYIHSLRSQYPNAVILVPSWSISWVGGSPEYLSDMLAHAERRLKIRLGKPWLMGISAGGRGGFPIYNDMPDRFRAFVCLANAPRTVDAIKLRPALRILMINGTNDSLVPEPVARRQARLAHKRVRLFRYNRIDKGSHFFLLERPKETYGKINTFMQDIEALDQKAGAIRQSP